MEAGHPAQTMPSRSATYQSSYYSLIDTMAIAFYNGFMQSNRPDEFQRRFKSAAVEDALCSVSSFIRDDQLAWMFKNCLPNTIDTTVYYNGDEEHPDTYVITGDIDAMWLRDSAAQMWPYLRYIREDVALNRCVEGLINRQVNCILLDPYANAFYREARDSEWAADRTEMKPGVHERKWELDSLCYFLRLSHGYWKAGGNSRCFGERWVQALQRILQTLRDEQSESVYRFQRLALRATETLLLEGEGSPSKTCGLIRSAFRPSDDACMLPFLIPSNHFAGVALRQAAEVALAVCQRQDLSSACGALAGEIEQELQQAARQVLSDGCEVWAYEVDGFGGRILMDDANVPSLLALPYLGCCSLNDPIYQSTRAFILSEKNPYFFKGPLAEGMGSPHVDKDLIWPMSIIMRAMTSDSDDEILQCLQQLLNTHNGTGFMHETIHKDDPAVYTRSWFAWANSLFGELILKLWDERRALLTVIFD